MRYGSNGCCTGRDCPEYGHGMFGDLCAMAVRRVVPGDHCEPEYLRLVRVERLARMVLANGDLAQGPVKELRRLAEVD